ncbi:tryptophan synthase subunit alpha [Amphibacillus cookii]|uniref:tryptophan synthase subunit alpha n=1 Tax=Amphibacillus cookii TaxID=767787 RepID=UPI00195A24C1|nr:tryptophan synthase subunit alpha [Amphibacillus cookii]MBM7540891.1 tryptophan synthase alpha chain [Amphibacillus cookii]
MPKAKLDQAFEQTLSKGDKIFVPYIMAGDGGIDALPEQIKFLQEQGATAIELGIPFSDPVADGPTIQAAGLRALAEGVSLRSVLDKLTETKQDRSIPIVLMTYLNPIYSYGIEAFALSCQQAGVDGIIVPDLPLEEEGLLTPSLADYQIALIRLAALTSSNQRLKKIATQTEGFLYAVTVTGTTGERAAFADKVTIYLEQLKTMTDKPVLAGFGVSKPEQVRALSKYCDGVVVGSKIVASLHENKRAEIKPLIQATKNRSAN